MKKIFLTLLVVCGLFFVVGFAQGKTIDLYFFWGQGCPYCAQMTQNLIEIKNDYPDLNIIQLEVWYSPLNAKLLNVLADAYKTKISGVPVIFIGETVIQGVETEKIFQLREAIRQCSITGCVSPANKIKTSENKPTLNYKNIAIAVGVLIFILILIFSLKKRNKQNRGTGI